MSRIVVIGAGLAGLVAANRLADAGHRVVLLHKGLGGLQLGQGSIDVLGYAPHRVMNPFNAATSVATSHPYAAIGRAALANGLNYLKSITNGLLVGDPEVNYQLPTAVGAIRPTCLAQPSMIAGHVHDGASWVIVGLPALKDFHPDLIAGNLERTTLPDGGRLRARALMTEAIAREPEVDSSALTYAKAFDDPEYRARFASALAPRLTVGEVVGLPAVLGLHHTMAWQDLSDKLGVPVFEIPLPPPCVPGIRLNTLLMRRAESLGVRVVPGVRTITYRADGDRVTSVSIATVPSPREFTGDAFVLATGGFESGALAMDSHGDVRETLFDLPLAGLDRKPLVHGDYWGPEQPIFAVGVSVNTAMQVVDADGSAVFTNLYAAGGILAGATRWTELSGDGIAVASALAAADSIGQERA